MVLSVGKKRTKGKGPRATLVKLVKSVNVFKPLSKFAGMDRWVANTSDDSVFKRARVSRLVTTEALKAHTYHGEHVWCIGVTHNPGTAAGSPRKQSKHENSSSTNSASLACSSANLVANGGDENRNTALGSKSSGKHPGSDVSSKKPKRDSLLPIKSQKRAADDPAHETAAVTAACGSHTVATKTVKSSSRMSATSKSKHDSKLKTESKTSRTTASHGVNANCSPSRFRSSAKLATSPLVQSQETAAEANSGEGAPGSRAKRNRYPNRPTASSQQRSSPHKKIRISRGSTRGGCIG